MSKRTSEDLPNSISIPEPNNLEGGDDDSEVFEGSELDAAADVTPAIGGDDFMHTDDFRRLFVEFVINDTLVAMRWLDKKWHKVVEKKLIELENEPFGEIIVHGGNDLSDDEANSDVREEEIEQVTKIVFLLNITKVGYGACALASNLVVVEIPEGVTIIGDSSFLGCNSLKVVTFPKPLTSIGGGCFRECYSLEEVDLLHTNVQKLGDYTFTDCTSLREMKVPDSLQTLGAVVFFNCSKLVPSGIDIRGYEDTTTEVVAYLRSIQ
ncbi:hypothetical protein TrVE_jg4141 [Triparma verrucosa]|uniref:Uncharacterized protein n=1 Tax=Triparma verrucosa TaxID=1606542 RepID=A0A9W7BNH1_9STRA|nr:hypothetical protein TrVE_jg4141 [Triparma verrucosa]